MSVPTGSAPALVLLTLLTAACTWKGFDPNGQPPVAEEDVLFAEVGVTTREEMLLKLGQPFWTSGADRVLIYLWAEDEHFFAPMAGQSRVVCRLHVAVFDAEGTLEKNGFLGPLSTNIIDGAGQPGFDDEVARAIQAWLDGDPEPGR